MSIISSAIYRPMARDQRKVNQDRVRRLVDQDGNAVVSDKSALRRMLADAAANTPASADPTAAVRLAREERQC